MLTPAQLTLVADNSRLVLKAGFGIILQSTVVLLLALSASVIFQRRGPTLQATILRTAICAVAAATVLNIAVGGRVRPLLSVSLPAFAQSRPVAIGSTPAGGEIVPNRSQLSVTLRAAPRRLDQPTRDIFRSVVSSRARRHGSRRRSCPKPTTRRGNRFECGHTDFESATQQDTEVQPLH